LAINALFKISDFKKANRNFIEYFNDPPFTKMCN
jgi:hypothetical protein